MATMKHYCKLCGGSKDNKVQHKWSGDRVLFSVPRHIVRNNNNPCCYSLKRGGTLKVYLNILSEDELKSIREEILRSRLFRQYRVHFLLHKRSTTHDDGQPGYGYANEKAKAWQLSKRPRLERLAIQLATLSGADRRNIGVNPDLYRDSKDGMGGHSDDDQDEWVVLCLMWPSSLSDDDGAS